MTAAEIKALTETEIQDRLYGSYLGRSRSRNRDFSAIAQADPPAAAQRPIVRPPAPAQPSPVSDRPWTGSEILAGEVKRLRSELISLRKEKEELSTRLQKMDSPKASSSGWFGRVLAVLVILGAVSFPLGAKMLQASPSPGEPTPYTVQVAVYDVRAMADRAMEYLRGLGYAAFLAEMKRTDGRPRYRIYVGSFVTKDEARREHLRLDMDPRFKEFKDAFVLIR